MYHICIKDKKEWQSYTAQSYRKLYGIFNASKAEF